MSQPSRRNSPNLTYLAVFFVPLLLAVGPAQAASRSTKPNKEAQGNAARVACLDGDFAEGVAILSQLFVQTKDPTYIFNQGRCFEQNRRYEDALARFQEYLRAGRSKLDASDKAEAEQHIADCKEMLAQQHGTAPAPPPTVIQPIVPSPPPAASKPEPESAPIVTRPAREPSSGSGGASLRIGGIVTASFGLAAVGAGVLSNLKANSTVNEMYSTPDGYTKESNRKTYATLAWVGYGVGAACIVTGAILYGVGLKAKSSHPGDYRFYSRCGPRSGRCHACWSILMRTSLSVILFPGGRNSPNALWLVVLTCIVRRELLQHCRPHPAEVQDASRLPRWLLLRNDHGREMPSGQQRRRFQRRRLDWRRRCWRREWS
jgi:hypothetical protein